MKSSQYDVMPSPSDNNSSSAAAAIGADDDAATRSSQPYDLLPPPAHPTTETVVVGSLARNSTAHGTLPLSLAFVPILSIVVVCLFVCF